MSTAASRPGGKFGSKFSGRGKTSLSGGRDNDGGVDISSGDVDNQIINSTTTTNSKNTPNMSSTMSSTMSLTSNNKITMEMIKIKKHESIQKYDIFHKLDQAESIVLDILNIAKETTKGLECLAKSEIEEKYDNNDNMNITATTIGNTSSIDENISPSSSPTSTRRRHHHNHQYWKKKIKQNGKLYMEKLRTIHDLLIPYKHLVVNYGAIQKQTEENREEDKKEEQGDDVLINDKNPSKNSDDSTTRDSTRSMYASRLEMKLAIEKKNLLNDIVQLERKMLEEEEDELKSSIRNNELSISSGDVKINGKRKREE